MKYTYNKLVRDKIPDSINSKKGKKAKFRIMNDEEYLKELNKKVLEEAREFIEENSVEELADVMEVIESIMKARNITWKDVRKAQQLKRELRGGFNNKLYLESVEEEQELER